MQLYREEKGKEEEEPQTDGECQIVRIYLNLKTETLLVCHCWLMLAHG